MKDAIIAIHTFFASVGPAWLAWLGTSLIVAAAIWWLVRRFVWHLPSRYEFEAEFSEPRNEEARDGLIYWAERAYEIFLNTGDPTLADWPLDRVVAKASAPNYAGQRNQSLRDWAATTPQNWDEGSPEHALWSFCTWLYKAAVTTADDQFAAGFLELRRCRRITAKFWDRWGRALNRDRLRLKDVEKILHSNRTQIRLVAYLEAAHALHESWDAGAGKISLFELAKSQDGQLR